MESLRFHEIFREADLGHMKEPPAPDAAAPLVLCDMPKRAAKHSVRDLRVGVRPQTAMLGQDIQLVAEHD